MTTNKEASYCRLLVWTTCIDIRCSQTTNYCQKYWIIEAYIKEKLSEFKIIFSNCTPICLLLDQEFIKKIKTFYKSLILSKILAIAFETKLLKYILIFQTQFT